MNIEVAYEVSNMGRWCSGNPAKAGQA